MKSDTLAQLLAALGVTRSLSRSHVSDDNAYSESQFKTLKYQPDYPGRFESLAVAQAYLQEFFGWHNDEHAHSGLALFTPADIFRGRVEAIRVVRQSALDAAYSAHPERFPNGAPTARLPPTEVHINPVTSDVVTVSKAAPTSGVRATAIDAGGRGDDDVATTTDVIARTPGGGAEPRGSMHSGSDEAHRRAERRQAARPTALAS